MSKVVLASIIFMSLALLLYSAGVFLERKDKEVWPRHAVLYGIALAFDIISVTIITVYAGLKTGDPIPTVITSNVNIIEELVGVVLLSVNVIWAIAVLREGTDKQLEIYHKFSLIIWVLWLAMYFLGLRTGTNLG